MAVSLPNGTTFAIASGYSAPITVSALSNANPGVATSAGHTLVNTDIVEVTSGWSRLTNKAVRVSAVASGVFSLEGIDTSSTTIYPAGGGTGSVRKVTGFTQIAQVLSSATNGGEQQFTNYQFLESDSEKRIPTTKSASGLTLTIADDPTQPGYILASAANDDRNPRIIKATLPNGSVILYNAYVTLNKTPTMNVNEIMSCEVTLSLLAEVVRYAS